MVRGEPHPRTMLEAVQPEKTAEERVLAGVHVLVVVRQHAARRTGGVGAKKGGRREISPAANLCVGFGFGGSGVRVPS